MAPRKPNARHLVLFLGAGASKPFGYPLTTEILPRMLEDLRKGHLFEPAWRVPDRTSGRRVSATRTLRAELRAFLPGAFGRTKQIPPVTDLLSLLDYMILTGSASHPGNPPDRLRRLRMLLERGVGMLLSETSDYPLQRRNRSQLANLVRWILEREATPGMRTTIISTNYDTLLESELYQRVYPTSEDELDRIDFGMTWRAVNWRFPLVHRPTRARLGIFKLHGSLNWLKCPLCESVYINRIANLMHLTFLEARRDVNTCVCGYSPLQPVLVAPSIVRDVRDVNLMALWRSAVEELRTADAWIMLGYSLPSEDIAIRSMLLRAYHGRDDQHRRRPRVRVIVHRKDTTARDRYRALFPNAVVENIGTEGFTRSLDA